MKILPAGQETYFERLFTACARENRGNPCSERGKRTNSPEGADICQRTVSALEEAKNTCEFFDGIVKGFTKSLCKT